MDIENNLNRWKKINDALGTIGIFCFRTILFGIPTAILLMTIILLRNGA